MSHFFGEPIRHLAASGIAQKIEHVDQTGTGKNALVTHVAELGPQIIEEFDLKIVHRGKVAVAAFRGEHMMTCSIPIKASLAKAGSGGDYGLVPAGFGDVVQRNYVAGGERANAPASGFKVVDQQGLMDMEFIGEALRLNDPWEVRGLHSSVGNRAGNSETRALRLHAGGFDELDDNLVEPRILLAGKNGGRQQIKFSIPHIKEGQPCVGASDVARQNHLSEFLQCRPSRSSSSSESFGPQLPDA